MPLSGRCSTARPGTAAEAAVFASPGTGNQNPRQSPTHLIAPSASWPLKYTVLPELSTSALPTPGTFFTATVPAEAPPELSGGAAAPSYPLLPPLHAASAAAARPSPAALATQ